MPNEFQQSPRIRRVQGDAIYNYYEAPPTLPPPPTPATSPTKNWRWFGAFTATVALAGALVNAQLDARTVYYCGSRNTVKYHTNATCSALQHCGARVRSMDLGSAKKKMQQCKVCH